MKPALFVLAMVVLPSTALAAQFVNQPIFLSKSPVTEGQKVRVYAVVENDGTAPFVGTVLIAENGNKLGAPAASLDIGATQTVSASWIPTAGPHTITAQLVDTDGNVVQQVSQSVSIAALPTPSTRTSTQGPAAALSGGLASLSPGVASSTLPILAAVDGLRQGAADALTFQIGVLRQGLAPSSAVHATAPSGHGAPPAASSSPSAGSSYFTWAYLYLLIVLRFIVGNWVVFYLLIVYLFIHGLWHAYKRFSGRDE